MSGFTVTEAGEIPYKKYHDIHLCVALETEYQDGKKRVRMSKQNKPYPLIVDGMCAYALPGANGNVKLFDKRSGVWI